MSKIRRHFNPAAWLLGYVELRVSGALPAAFLNLCTRQGVALQNVEAEDDYTLHLFVTASELPAAQRAAERSGCTAQILRRKGAPETWKGLRRQLSLCIGALGVLLVLFGSSLFIWDIEVAENPSSVPDSEILSVLDDIGVGIGSFWPGLRADMIASRALVELPELSFLTVNVRGSRAEVLVRAAVPVPEILDEKSPVDIVAARDAVIEEMRVLEGEAQLAAGDTVLAGELLVSGHRGGDLADERLVHARAEIIGRTWYEITACAPLEAQIRTAEGAIHRRLAFFFGKRQLNFALRSGIPQETCDKITSVCALSIPGVFTLPLGLTWEERRPAQLQSVLRSREETAAALEKKLLASLQEKLGEEGSVIRSDFSCSEGDGLLYVTLRAECLERIDREQTIE